MSTPNPRDKADGPSVYFQAGGIFLAAVLLGFAYNHSSPLGVRAARPEEKSTPVGMANAANVPVALARTGYVNQTVAISLEPATPNRQVVPANQSSAVAPTTNHARFPA